MFLNVFVLRNNTLAFVWMDKRHKKVVNPLSIVSMIQEGEIHCSKIDFDCIDSFAHFFFH